MVGNRARDLVDGMQNCVSQFWGLAGKDERTAHDQVHTLIDPAECGDSGSRVCGAVPRGVSASVGIRARVGQLDRSLRRPGRCAGRGQDRSTVRHTPRTPRRRGSGRRNNLRRPRRRAHLVCAHVCSRSRRVRAPLRNPLSHNRNGRRFPSREPGRAYLGGGTEPGSGCQRCGDRTQPHHVWWFRAARARSRSRSTMSLEREVNRRRLRYGRPRRRLARRTLTARSGFYSGGTCVSSMVWARRLEP